MPPLVCLDGVADTGVDFEHVNRQAKQVGDNPPLVVERGIIGGYAVRSLAIFGYIFVDSAWQLMLVQIILGLGEAFTLPAYDALFTQHIDKGQEASRWGDWEAMAYIVTALSAIVGAGIATAFGFQVVFIAMFGVSILGLILSIRLMPGIMQKLPKRASVRLTRKPK